MMRATPFLLPLVVFVITLGACGVGPTLDVPTRGVEEYSELRPRAVHAVSNSEVVVVGDLRRKDGTPEGLILITEDGGRTWRRQASEAHPLRRTTFQALDYTDRLRGWIGGIEVDDRGATRPVVYSTIDGGNHWRVTRLPQDPAVLATEIHSIVFVNDYQGQVAVTVLDPETSEPRQTTFHTNDSGRSWIAATYRGAAGAPLHDQTVSMLNEQQGYRIGTSPYAGVTLLEITGSAGQDWMPVCEFNLGQLPTYYH